MYPIFMVLGMAGGGSGQQGGNPLLSFLPLFLIIAIMYFLMLRPQAKKQKEHRKMLQELEKGDKIVTSGGILGTIAGIKEKENTVLVKVAENIKLEITRSSVGQVIKKKSE